MGLFKRIFGICETKLPKDMDCWRHSGRQVRIDLSRVPELAEPGGAIRIEGKGLPGRILILRGDEENFRAFVNKCTHMGRRLDPIPVSRTIRCCSLSKSTFDYSGKLVSGPAKRPLTALSVEKPVPAPIGSNSVSVESFSLFESAKTIFP